MSATLHLLPDGSQAVCTIQALRSTVLWSYNNSYLQHHIAERSVTYQYRCKSPNPGHYRLTTQRISDAVYFPKGNVPTQRRNRLRRTAVFFYDSIGRSSVARSVCLACMSPRGPRCWRRAHASGRGSGAKNTISCESDWRVAQTAW
jgi:hypothetical protein